MKMFYILHMFDNMTGEKLVNPFYHPLVIMNSLGSVSQHRLSNFILPIIILPWTPGMSKQGMETVLIF